LQEITYSQFTEDAYVDSDSIPVFDFLDSSLFECINDLRADPMKYSKEIRSFGIPGINPFLT